MGETQEGQHSPETFFTIHMADPQEVHLRKIANGVKETQFLEDNSFHGPTSRKKLYYRWFRIVIHSVLVLVCGSAATLLGRLYYEKGGKNDSGSTQISKKKYVIGFIATVCASAGYGLWLSLTQLVFKKVMKRETLKVIMDMIIYTFLVGTCAIIVGLFASGEWKGLKNEMKEYETGKASYLLNLTFTAIFWQLFTIGCLGLTSEVSSLFCNAITVLRVPLVPMLAVIFFHDKMYGIKVISMMLAIWGIISYLYQQYLDDTESKNRNTIHHPKASASLEEVHK
ncbi:Purine permease [Vigna unguiculata]|uniref:Purine permease n=1 Tax=Vigna unguiculata TaxID=3917 RepID=A0A4D6KKY0_VIGUN|nr:Purine permease [Vigna unguiculata]